MPVAGFLFPSSDTAVSGSWTNPTNVQSDNNADATVAPGKNTTASRDAGGFGLSIPVGSTIDKVEIRAGWWVSTTSSIATLRLNAKVGANVLANHDVTSEPTSETQTTFDITADRSWSASDFADGTFFIRFSAVQGNSSTSVTFHYDYVCVRVTYNSTISVDVGSYAISGTAATLSHDSGGGGGGFKIGINFRDTAGFVTDGTDETYCIEDAYPTTRGGVTFGWSGLNGDAGRDRNSGIDRRLAGCNQQSNSGSQATFRLDLPNTGTYTIRLAIGDASFDQVYLRADVYDNTTLLFTALDTDGILAPKWIDAQSTEYNATDWPTLNTAQTGLTFATTTLILKLGAMSSTSGNTPISHLYVEEEGGGGGGATISVDPGSYSLTGTAAALKWNRKISAASSSFSVTGTAASLKWGHRLAAGAGSLAITGTAVALKRNVPISAGAGSFSLSGTAANLKWNRRLSAAGGSYALAGTAAGLLKGATLSAASGTYAMSGTAASVRWNRKISAATGSYSLTGTAASTHRDIKLTAQSGGYTLTGTSADLIDSGAAARVDAESGSFSISGTAATLKWNRRLSAQAGSYSLAGAAASLERGYKLTADPGGYSLTGTAAALRTGHRGSAETGSYVFTGTAAALLRTRILTLAPGAYTLNGIDATLDHGGQIPPAARLGRAKLRNFEAATNSRSFEGATANRTFKGSTKQRTFSGRTSIRDFGG